VATKIKYDVEDLKLLNDQDLIEIIYKKSCELYFETSSEYFRNTHPAFFELFAMRVLDAKVQNGGFDLFFQNKNDIEIANYAKMGMRRIGASELEDIIGSAIKIFENQSNKFEKVKNPEFYILDGRYYDFTELEYLQTRYVKRNLAKFVVTEN